MASSSSTLPSAASLSLIAEVARNMKEWTHMRLGNIPTPRTTSSELPLVELAVNTFHLKAQSIMLRPQHAAPSYLPSAIALLIDRFYISQMRKLKGALAENLRSALETMHNQSSRSLRSTAPLLVNAYVTRCQFASSALQKRILEHARTYREAQQHTRSSVHQKLGFNADYKPFLLLCFDSNAYPSTAEREQIATLTQMTFDQITNWFQNHRNRRKREGSELARPAPFQNSSRSIDDLFHSWDHSPDLEDDELSDDETVVDEEEVNHEDDIFAPSYRHPMVFPTKYTWESDANFLSAFRPELADVTWPSRSNQRQTSDAKPDFGELCDLFSRLKLDGKRSTMLPTQQRKSTIRESLGQAFSKVLRLCAGRHPAYIPPSKCHLYPAYSPTSLSLPLQAATPQKSPKKRSGFPKRIPRTAPSHHPHSVSSRSSSPTRSGTRTPSILSVASSTATLASRAASVASDTCSADDLLTPPPVFAELPYFGPIIAEPDFHNYDVGLGSMNDGLEALFSDEQQWGEFMSQLLAESRVGKTGEWEWTVPDQPPLLDAVVPVPLVRLMN